MSVSIQKTPEELQAQVAAFTHDTIDCPPDRAYIFANIGSIANGEMTEVLNCDQSSASSKGYIDYLRAVGGVDAENIKIRAELLSAYDEFAPEIEHLKSELDGTDNDEKHSSYLGGGVSAKAFFISKGAKDFVIRRPHDQERLHGSGVDSYIRKFTPAKGLPHIEQIVAASYDTGVTISERMPGKTVDRLSVDDYEKVKESQVDEFVKTLIKAHQAGIEIDPKLSNFLYDPEAGFGVVDISVFEPTERRTSSPLSKVLGFASHVACGAYVNTLKFPDKEAYSAQLPAIIVNLRLLTQYRNSIIHRVDNETAEAALNQGSETINDKIETYKVEIEDYSDPQWVEADIKEKAEALEKYSEKSRARRKTLYKNP